MQFDQLHRRKSITLLGGATAWPLAASAQQTDRAKLVGVLLLSTESDSQMQARFTVLRQELANLGWADAGNIRLEPRWVAGSLKTAKALGLEVPQTLLARADEVIE